MLESAVVLVIDRDSVLRVLRSDSDLKRLVSLDRVSAVTLFGSPVLILEMIPNDDILLRTHADVQHNIVSRLQCCSALNVYLKTKKYSYQSVQTFLLSNFSDKTADD